ncbi:hypothetical protein RRG08_046175 [Elysia crispata]|uniref:C-type lectin domain-containing protein n=1 Tax=Elysia crispata TaxID=231223 RepID=A0AAE0XNA9_9GAST|nr:hypothetical protein RRG08_046175 [Elysia crispata]
MAGTLLLVSLCLSLFLGSLAFTVPICPYTVRAKIHPGYLRMFGNWCYFFDVYERKTHDMARKKCQSLGGTLAMPKTEAINSFLSRELENTYNVFHPVWIGLHDTYNEGQFLWDDGSSLNWNNFEVTSGLWFPYLENCVALHPLLETWEDYHCFANFFVISARKPFVCQFSAQRSWPAGTADFYLPKDTPSYGVKDRDTLKLKDNIRDVDKDKSKDANQDVDNDKSKNKDLDVDMNKSKDVNQNVDNDKPKNKNQDVQDKSKDVNQDVDNLGTLRRYQLTIEKARIFCRYPEWFHSAHDRE